MNALAGKRILVVEDEVLIAFALEDLLLQLECVVIGPAHSLADALELLDRQPLDAALLDVNLDGVRSYRLAERLAERGVPFVFVTGCAEDSVDWTGGPAKILHKPYTDDAIRAVLLAQLA